MKAVIVGGGVIGLCCAHTLAQMNAEVVVVERDRCGQGASLGNAGWVTPGLSGPIPGPGVMTQALKWTIKPDSPFWLRPRLSLDFVRWCWRFSRSCSADQFEQGAAATVALNSRTLELFDELRADGVRFEMHSTGLIFAGLVRDTIDDYERMFEQLFALGYRGDVERLDGRELRRLEPALSARVVGGLFARAERYVRPETLVRGLLAQLASSGVDVLEGTEVMELDRDGTGWSVRTCRDELRADRVIVAGGVWSRDLLARLGVRIPLEAAKGYSITAEGTGTRPRHALYLAEAKVGCSPFDGTVRLAGTLELAGVDLSLNRRRLAALAAAASSYLHDWRPDGVELEWSGLRPLTPDGLPLIGSVPGLDGLYVATGHAMLGVTLAPATAASLAPLVVEDRLVPELAPFRLDRFL